MDGYRTGTIVDHYRVRGKLGEGGMGAVYKIQDMDSGEILAMKIVDEETAERFMAEVRALAKLRHPNVIGFRTIWPMPDGSIALMMDFVPGSDLASLARDGLRPRDAVDLLHQVALGLDYCHGKDVVHRDVKPANVMVTEAGSPGTALLVDFGLGKDRGVSADQTALGMGAGTAPYMPPEQMYDFRDAGPAADQWSLAVSAWQLLTGGFPFPGSPSHYAGRSAFHEVAPDLPAELNDVFVVAFSEDPESRHPTCVDFTKLLGAGLGMELPVSAAQRERGTVKEPVVPVVPVIDWSELESDDLWGYCASRMGNSIRTVAATRREQKLKLGTVDISVRVRGDSVLVELPGRNRKLPVDLTTDLRVQKLEALGWRRPRGRFRKWSLQVPVEHDPTDAAKRVLRALEIGYGLAANSVYRYL